QVDGGNGSPAIQPVRFVSSSATTAPGMACPLAGGQTPSPPGDPQDGTYVVTITESGSEARGSFTLHQTGTASYHPAVNTSQHYAWDVSASVDYTITQDSGGTSGSDSFTDHREGDGSNIQVDGGSWGGPADSNSANPFSFGLYDYNRTRFALDANWTQFTW